MKKLLLSVIGIFAVGFLSAQVYPYVDINQISFVSQTDLQNCNDSSAYLGDTVVTRGIVVTDGNLSEVASSSIQGGSRPFISLVDTSANGAPGAFKGAVVMGAFNNIPNSNIENALAGDIIEITCVVAEFGGLVQLQPISSNAVSFVGVTNAPSFTTVPVSDLQDNQRINKLATGEQWEGSYVEIQNVTVTSVSIFSSGNRIEFTVEDAAGNRILVADRFLPMKLAGVTPVNPNSPATSGSLVAPSVGTVYNHIRGIIFQDENGPCYPNASGFAGGYEINPFDSTHFDKAASPANISNVSRDPLVPNASQAVTVSADIIDNDGVVTSATLFYTADQNAPANLFTSVPMTNSSGSIYTATIPATPLDSVVRYFIEATDDSSNVTINPNTPTGANLRTHFYTVRPNGPTIMDIQFVPELSNDGSTLEGDTITVTGVVTASYQAGDLGFLYMQDPSANEFSGIFVNGGPATVFGLNRGDEITVEGVVEESFGFTQLNAINVTATGATGVAVTPVVIDPSDATLFTSGSRELERYESMLLSFENPAMGGLVYVTDTTLNFAEYLVGSGFQAQVGARVLAGRQVAGQAQGSLDVSYINDTAAWGGALNVPAVQVDENYNVTALEGILFYAFGNYKLTPRNNMDFKNLVVGIETVYNSEVETTIFPNPTNGNVTVQIDENYVFNTMNIQILDVTGRVVVETISALSTNNMNLSGLEKGIYVVRLTNNNELIHSSKLILK